MKRSSFLGIYLEVVFLLIGITLMAEGMTLNQNIGSNWSPPRKGSSYSKVKSSISREAVLPQGTSVGGSDVGAAASTGLHMSSPYYSTLPDIAGSDGSVRTAGSSGSSSNSFGVGGVSNNDNLVIGGPGQPSDYYNYQVSQGDSGNQQYHETQQHFDYQPFYQNQFPSGQGQPEFQQGSPEFGGFSDDETGLEETSGDIGLLSIMSNFIDQIPGVGSLVSGVREMFSNLGGRSEFFSGVMPYMMMVPGTMMMALPMLGMGALGLMALPVIQLTLPGIRRSFSDTATLTQDVLKSEQCVERFSCNLARIAKKIPYEGWISSKLEKSDNKWLSRVSRSFKAARTGEECSQFACGPLTRMQKRVRTFFLGDKDKIKELSSKSSNTTSSS